MPRRTFAELKASRIPTALKLCPTDPRFAQILNEAEEILIEAGNSWGTFARYRCRVSGGLIVTPQQVAAIQFAAVCNTPVKTRSMYWEFREMGMGIQDVPPSTTTSGCCGGGGLCFGPSEFVDRGNLPVFNPITGITNKVKLYCDVSLDAGVQATVMGIDENGNWIRTLAGGSYEDGEPIMASQIGTLSTHIFSDITGFVKPVTAGVLRLYAVDTITGLQTLLANYDYETTTPSFRVWYCQALDNPQVAANPVFIDLLVKLDFVPMVNDTDFAMIGNIPALKVMCQAVLDSEKEDDGTKRHQVLLGGLAVAKGFLENELLHYQGAPEELIQMQGVGGPTGELLENFV